MGMPAILPHYWTAEEVLAIPESPGYRFEAVDGELIVSPSPSYAHQRAVGALVTWLTTYAEENRIGVVLSAPFDVVADAKTVVQPDVLVLPLVGDRVPSGWPDAGRLLLAIEVLSPSSIRADRFLKRGKYQAMGWPTWLVDLEQQTVEVWHPDTETAAVCTERLEWSPRQGLPSFVIDLRRLFAKAAGAEL